MAKTADTYELVYGYMHCIGRTVYTAGFAESRQAAEEWVHRHRKSNGSPLAAPKEDPVRWCPVRHCHMKRQQPWVDCRPAVSHPPTP